MTLADTLAEARTTWRRGFTPEQVRTMDYAAQWLAQSGVEEGRCGVANWRLSSRSPTRTGGWCG